ncbi:MAG TPA: dTDP-4-dehydrorhamnose 3,5-epimerase family protein, partial [Herpetosiphonaceae bacterium]
MTALVRMRELPAIMCASAAKTRSLMFAYYPQGRTMEVQTTSLEGVLLLKPKVHQDERGFFIESYSARTLESFGIQTAFVQDNHSRS